MGMKENDSSTALNIGFMVCCLFYGLELVAGTCSTSSSFDGCSDIKRMTLQCDAQMKSASQESCPAVGDEDLKSVPPFTCSQPNPANKCAGMMCYVNNVDSCRSIMRREGCGFATFSASRSAKGPFECKMIFSRPASTPYEAPIYFKPNVTEILYFKMYSGVGVSGPVDAFLNWNVSPEILFPRTKVTNFSTSLYYKSPLWNIRDELGAKIVTVSMHGNMDNTGHDSCDLTFAHSKGSNGEWFNKDNLVASYPPNVFQLKSLTYAVFSIHGVSGHDAHRQFYGMQHGGCPNDIGPMAVLSAPDVCSWGNSEQPIPRFKCAAAWSSDAPLTVNEPNMNIYGRFMRELEVTGRLIKPISLLYSSNYQ